MRAGLSGLTSASDGNGMASPPYPSVPTVFFATRRSPLCAGAAVDGFPHHRIPTYPARRVPSVGLSLPVGKLSCKLVLGVIRMSTAIVRVSEAAWQSLKHLSERCGVTMQEIVDRAVEDYRRKLFLEEVNLAYAVLRSDPGAWQEELEERKLWDAVLADGAEEGEGPQ